MSDENKKSITSLLDAFKDFAEDIENKSGEFSKETQEKLEKFINDKLNDVNSNMGKERLENAQKIQTISDKLDEIEKLVNGEVAKQSSFEQNNLQEITFSNNFDFDPTHIIYTIEGKEYIGQIQGEEIVGTYIENGYMGKKGDGNETGKIKFSKNLDKKTKLVFEAGHDGIQAEISNLRALLSNLEDTTKKNSGKIENIKSKIEQAAGTLKSI